MNSREKTTAQRVARLMRAGRKIVGLSQIELAARLGVVQGSISKMESGRLIPSVTQWFEFCEVTEIPTQSYKTGYIDRMRKVALRQGSQEGAYRIPDAFADDRGTAVRSLLPILQFLEEELGATKADKYYRSELRLDPDYFVAMDNQLNLEFMLRVARQLHKSGRLNPPNLKRLVRRAYQPELHGALHSVYDQTRSGPQVLEALVHNAGYYDCNYDYCVVESKGSRLTIEVKPQAHLLGTRYRNDADLGDFLCRYRKSFFQSFSLGKGGGHSAEILDKECEFQGGAKCVYDVRFQ